MEQTKKYWFLQERFIFGLVTIISLVGIFSWFNINEQEDPFFPYRNGHVIIVAPGMSAKAIEDSIVQPFERLLSSVDGINSVSSEVSDGTASVDIELKETVSNTDLVWQRVREKVTEGQSQFAQLVTKFELDDRVQDTDSIFLNIHSTKSLLETRRYALYVRDELYKMPSIREVEVVGAPEEEIEVFFPQEQMIEFGISPLEVAEQIDEANSLKNIGLIKGQLYQSNISSVTRLNHVDDLAKVKIKTADNSTLALAEIAQIREVASPIQNESYWLNGTKSIGLSIVVPPNQLRVTDFGDLLLKRIEALNNNNPEFTLTPVFFQPEWTKKRRDDLALSLLYSSIGVGLVLFLLMSKKVAFVVAITIPAIALSSIAVFGMTGGVLHQMSIAGLIISLGLMVDNSIVMSELISRYRSQNLSRIDASKKAIKDLYQPLATSTFTTIAAFIPMLLSEGNVADFIRMIPVIVIIAILVSYLYSLALLPAISNNLNTFSEGGSSQYFDRLSRIFSTMGIRHTKSVIVGFIAIVVLATMSASNGEGEFFPKSSRNQAIIDIEGSYGLSHDATLETVKRVESILAELSSVTKVVSFVGNSGPSFYYNLNASPNEPNIARVVFETQSNQQIPEMVKKLNAVFAKNFISTRVRAREIGQGPPIEAPIEIRLLGDERNKLLAASEQVFIALNDNSMTADTRRKYVVGKPILSFEIDELQLKKTSITRTEISNFVAWRTQGMAVTSLPKEREMISVILRDQRNIELADAEYIMNSQLMSQNGEFYPLSLLANQKFTGEPPILTRWNGFNSMVINSDVVASGNVGTVISTLQPKLLEIANQYGVELQFGGEEQEQSSSNDALIKTLPIGAILLFGALIIQFNSYRIAALIMVTIPLAMVGVLPTLSLVGVNFGFMSILGVLALTGIVVNTAIILIDSVLVKLKQGESLEFAIESATSDRFRPVLLTACTTIVGMIPLTSPSSPLWPPMAWTIIGGLITSTVLTLIVLPACLKLMLTEQHKITEKQIESIDH